MKSFAFAALVASAVAFPQAIDKAAVAALGEVPTPDIPVVKASAVATTATYESAAAAASIHAAVSADPDNSDLKRRDCSAPAEDDDVDTFLGREDISQAATSAPTPQGYTRAYQNKNGASEGIFGYMGYSTLDTYDTAKCASRCDNVKGCSSFNLYYERDPVTDPTAACPNPASETVIKCVYYGGFMKESSATNVGQWRRQFHVVIAGSNGYTNTWIDTPSGYEGPTALGQAAINAPLDCNNDDTYLTFKTFTTGPFDAAKCAAACTAESDYARAHPPKDGEPKTCQFFNTYLLYKNGKSVAQYCSLYSQSWPRSFAVNRGYYSGNDHYTIDYSYSFSNGTAGADQPEGCTNPTKPQ